MALEHESDTPLSQAVRIAGSQSAFGRMVNRAQATVHDWLKVDRLPAEHVLTVERETGISRHDLRPDLYPRDPAPIAASDDRRPATMERAA